MKRYLISFLTALAVLGITARVFCYPVDAVDISGKKYFPAVKEAIVKAQESIKVVMFAMEASLSREDTKPNQLIGALIEAKKRGVEVEVILDQNIDFLKTKIWETKVKSTRAYKRLKEAGVKVYYDEPARYTHAKTVIIDKKIVILGSTNWTEASFDNNIETSVLINSEKLAGEILTYLKTIKIDTKIDEYLDSIGPSIPVSWKFMENLALAPEMVKLQDERAFDVYLYLLWKFSEKIGDSPQKAGTVPYFTLFYDDLAKYLGIYEGWNSTDYRRQIIKVFKKLEQRYKLIKFEPRYAKEATITLLDYEKNGDSPQKAGTVPIFYDEEGDYFDLPEDYFKLGWNRELSLRAKFCYLINLANIDISDLKPYWSKSVITITKQFGGIGKSVIQKGMGELRRNNLLEVRYDELSGKPYEERRPKMYKLLRLYDPKERELRLKGMEEKYGKEVYVKARKYAEIVFEEKNPEVIEDIILKMKEYGDKEVERAFGEISRKSIDNPKRTYLYLTRILGRTSGGLGKPR
ncbi:MAG: phospholipase D-like domain-containing protein [Candidatus Omnitrophota bacterium]|nr:phospholipase D-like domain-containing protein [Candidatus Omnitrophota bacterium]